MAEREYRALVHEEDGAYWAEVEELPGCFASGHDLDELRAALVEAITFYLEGERSSGVPQARASAHVDEMRVLVSP
ncbi:MAG TPA: type II toxin-antitoxin system HicB family antitoxin [Gaiella sp.]|jgi:predicted RNase H-like HicB family nuclease|nr:type II toxin-antitoxin system HicB family antitoxin [Gaiella sp.]